MKNKYQKYQQQMKILLERSKGFAIRNLKSYLAWQHSWKTTSAGVLVVFVVGLFAFSMLHATALTVTLTPNGDITTGWASPSTAGSHYVLVDDGVTDNTSDYVGTGTAGSGGEIEEYDMATQTGISSASQIVLRVYAQSATNANGGTLDDITINIRINGTLQTATTCTPAYNTWGACTATYSGSWTQSDIDSLRVQITRVKQGGGSPSNQDDDVRIANVYTTLTYTPTLTVTQSAYRWFANQDLSSSATYLEAVGLNGNEIGRSIDKTSDGGYVVGGETSAGGAGGFDALIIKYDKSGVVTWSKMWGGTLADYAYSVKQTSDGGYILVGETQSYGDGGSDAFLAKFTSAGVLSWSTVWGGTGTDVGYSVTQTSDGGYAITGYTSSYGIGGSNDAYIAKFTSAGVLSWSTVWGGTNPDLARSIIQTSDGGYAIAGNTPNYGAGGDDAFLAKFTSAGVLSWSQTWGGTSNDYGYSVIQTSDGGYVMSGYTASYTAGLYDAFLAKFTSAGVLSWSQTWGGTSNDYGYSVIQTSDGGYAVSGETTSYGNGNSDVVLLKYTSAGVLSWDTTWGNTTGTDYSWAGVQTSDGGYMLTGTTSAYGTGKETIMARFSPSGTMDNCGSLCTSPPTTTGVSQSATSTSPSATSTSPSATSTSPSVVLNTPSITITPVVLPGPSIDVGSSLTVAQDTVATAPAEGTPFRLRLDLHVGGSTIAAGGAQYKLRYALKGAAASCSAVASTSFADVTDTTPIQYYDNPNAVNGLGLTTNANDPTHSTDSLVRQTYQEKGTTTFTNPTAITQGSDGMWDFALVGYHTIQNDRYCFKVVNSNGTNIDTYNVFPELIIPPATFSQAAYRWYNPAPSGSSMTFVSAYGGSSLDESQSMVQTTDGGYAVTGDTWSFGPGDDMFLAKYDAAGNLSWSKTWGGTGDDRGYSLVQTTDGGYAVTGHTATYGAAAGNGYSDMFLAKYDAAGNLSWSKTWGNSGDEGGNSLVQTTDGGYAVTGYSTSYGGGSYVMFLAKYDAAGNLSWSKTLSLGLTDRGYSLVQTTDGGYAVTGYSTTAMFLAKYDAAGNLSWIRTWGGINIGQGNSLVQTTDGGYAVTGYITGFGAGNYDMFLAKYDAAGNLSWSKTWGGINIDQGNSLVQTTDGGYAVTGLTNSFGAGDYDMFLAKYDSSGSVAGCNSPMCQSPTFTTTSPTATTTSPTATTTSPTVSTTSPTATTTSVTFVTTRILASSVPVGNPLAPENSPLDLSSLTPLSLRVAVAVDSSGVAINDIQFKLQYAVKAGATSCSTVPTGNFADVTLSSAIAYYDDSSYASGQLIIDNPNDPSDGIRTMVPQSYQESNNFTNSASNVYAGQDGMWQFSLVINNSTLKGKDFCLRVYSITGSSILTAANVADVAYAPQMYQLMRDGEWFNRQGILQPFSL